MARYDDGQVLYFEGAVEVVEERLREPASRYGTHKVAGGVYSVRGSRGRYAVTCEIPVLGVPEVACECEDYRRRGQTCKHGYAVLRHILDVDRRMSLESRIKSAREALANGGGLKPEHYRRSLESAARDLAELGPGEQKAAEAAAIAAKRKEPAKRVRASVPVGDDDGLPL